MATITHESVQEDTLQHLTLQHPDRAGPRDVAAEVLYSKEADDGTPLTLDSIHSSDINFKESRKVLIKDVRNDISDFTLEKHGFEYVNHEVPQAHFVNEESIKAVHYPEIEAFIAKS